MAREQDGMMHRGIGMTSERTRERLISGSSLPSRWALARFRRSTRHAS